MWVRQHKGKAYHRTRPLGGRPTVFVILPSYSVVFLLMYSARSLEYRMVWLL